MDELDFLIRDAVEPDIAALDALQPMGSVHADRIHRRDNGYRYVVCEVDDRLIGFGMIVFRAPPGWERPDHVPLMLNLFIAPDHRSRGYGSAMIETMERAAMSREFPCMYLCVEPERNPRAIALYRRLGYQPLQNKPFREPYRFVDSSGCVHEGVEHLIEMRKWLA